MNSISGRIQFIGDRMQSIGDRLLLKSRIRTLKRNNTIMKFDKYVLPNGKTYVRSTDNGSLNEQDFLEFIENSTALTKADGLAVLECIRAFIANNLKEGKTITFNKIGTFGASFSIKEEGKQTGKSVEFKRVTFKASPTLKKDIKDGLQIHQRAKGYRRNDKNNYSIEERRTLLKELLKEEKQIVPYRYVALTTVCKAQAYKDLKKFVEEGWLKEQHFGKAKLYSLK